MARRKAAEASALKNWDEVNEALRQMAIAEIAISDIESGMEKQIIGIKKSAELESQQYQDRIKALVKDIEAFASQHGEDFSKKKTMQLNFGEVGYRLSTKINLPKAKDKLQDILRRLRNYGMDDCIVTKENVNKEALKQYGEDRVLEVGAGWKQKDEFWCESAKEKLSLWKL